MGTEGHCKPLREPALIRRILAVHGARRDLRLWRNPTAHAYVGRLVRRSLGNEVVLAQAHPIQAGLCEGSADLIGIKDGRFVALEVKTKGSRLTERQERFLRVIKDMGGISGVVRSVEDVTALLGAP